VPLGLALPPGGGPPVAVLARDMGLVVRDVHGSWRLLCAPALGVGSGARLRLLATGPDRVLVGSYVGLQQLLPDACGWDFVSSELEGPSVQALVRHPQDDAATFMLVAENGTGELLVSDDTAASWSSLATFDEGVPAGLVVAPSDADVLYVHVFPSEVSPDAGPRDPFVAASTDGGATFVEHPLSTEEGRVFGLLAVDPVDPRRLFAVDRRPESHAGSASAEAAPDAVWVSEDGGATWATLREVGTFGGFAIRGDGGAMWIGDTDGELLRSDDGGATFEVVDAGVHVHCLEHDGAALWICAEHLLDGFSVGAWPDDADGIEPHMRFDEPAGLLACDATSVAACANIWESWQFWQAYSADAGVSLPAVDAGAGPGGDGGDEGLEDDDGGGCGCRMHRTRATGTTGTPFLLGAFAWWARRRRRAAAVRRSTSRA